MSLVSWQSRLDSHFGQLRRKRAAQVVPRPLFGLEHGLNALELDQLKEDIRAHIAKSPPSREHPLPWMVYACEMGYRYAGDEYWQTFEERTPGWKLTGAETGFVDVSTDSTTGLVARSLPARGQNTSLSSVGRSHTRSCRRICRGSLHAFSMTQGTPLPLSTSTPGGTGESDRRARMERYVEVSATATGARLRWPNCGGAFAAGRAGVRPPHSLYHAPAHLHRPRWRKARQGVASRSAAPSPSADSIPRSFHGADASTNATDTEN